MSKKKPRFNETPSVEAVEWRAKDYFDNVPEEEWTKAGLYFALKISPRVFSSLKKRQEYRDICEWCELHFQMLYEKGLKRQNNTGAIFALKNMGWSDRGEIHATLSGSISLEQMLEGKKPKA